MVETPGPRAAAAADIATLKALRGQGQAVRAPARACAKLAPVRHQYWFFYGYRPGLRTVARQLLH